MPMVPEALFAMYACCAHRRDPFRRVRRVRGKGACDRLDDCKPKLILSASCGIEVAPRRSLQAAARCRDRPQPGEARGVPDPAAPAMRRAADARPRPRLGLAARKALAANKVAPCVPVLATDPLYILYTSGTTGIPKGVVRDNGGHMVALNWSMKNHYGVDPGEVYWAASDIGWVVGHSYIVYAPLFAGCTTILYEGKPVGTPDCRRVLARHRRAQMRRDVHAPTAFRAIKKEDPAGKLFAQYDFAKFRTLFLAGERADPATVEWAEQLLKVPVIDHWWQTETGWAIAGNPMGLGMLPVKHGSPTVAMPGYDVRIVDEQCKEVAVGKMGSIVVKLPLPPSCLPTLWQQDERFRESYLAEFPGYYKTADAGFKDEDGYLFIMGRTDDIINVAGHRLSTGGMERCWRATRTSPNAPSLELRTPSRARCRAASSCSRPA
jgi:propionyl-CoA synthetase